MQGSSEDTGLGSLCHRLLCGDINVLSAPRVLALVMGNERRDGRLGTGVQIRLGDTHPHRWTVVITGQDQSVLAFSFASEKRNPEVNDRVFKFQMPAGATLVTQEAQ